MGLGGMHGVCAQWLTLALPFKCSMAVLSNKVLTNNTMYYDNHKQDSNTKRVHM